MSYWPLAINGAALLGCAVFVPADHEYRGLLLIGLMLLTPLWDRRFSNIQLRTVLRTPMLPSIALMIAIAVLSLQTGWMQSLRQLLLVALPEEWFFRSYMLIALLDLAGSSAIANLVSSALFALLHVPTQGIMGLSVMLPSLLFGWVYLRTRSLTLVVLLHAFSNLAYARYADEASAFFNTLI